MVLICDVCRAEINNSANNDEFTSSISLFPCFHKHCDRCKCAAHAPNGRVSCKVCGCQCLPKHIYDYAETQLEKIFCMFCNLKNRAQVEWRCETCQKSYMCNACTKPHIASGHTLTSVKAYVPSHSQCHSHLNLSATYLCSCHTRLCVHCLNIHANGQLVAPHEQRYPFAQLAEQAKLRIQNIRTNSQREMDNAQKILPVLQRNKNFVHEMASKARSAVAEQIVELSNALIRRGNDIVTHIDLFEQEKLQKYETVGNELKHIVDHFKKIENFSENVLVTAQNDHPGMYSASEFVHNSVSMISKKLETLQHDIELTQRLPKINYQSDPTQLLQSIQALGIIDVDGHKTVPMLTTPSNAQMFTVTNAAAPSHQAVPSVPVSTIRPTLTAVNPHISSTVRHGPTLMRQNQNTGQPMAANVSTSANPFNVPLPPNVGIVQPTQQQQQLLNSGRTMNAPQVSPVHLVPTSSVGTGVLSHLLQQGINTAAVSGANHSQSNTPITANFPQIRQQQQTAVHHHHQQQLIHQQQQQQQQHQLALHQQQMQRQQAVRNQMMCQQQQQQLLQQQQYVQQQQQQQPSHCQSVNIQQNQMILKQLQAQQQLFQQQQQQQQRQLNEQQSPVGVSTSAHCQALTQNSNVSTAPEHERRLLLRLPNPYKQQTNQPQMVNPALSADSSSSMSQIAAPPQTRQAAQQRQDLDAFHPVQQQQIPSRPSQKNPVLVELMDDDDEEADKAKTKTLSSQSHPPNPGCSHMLDSHEERQLMNHSQISRLKAQSAAADSTVNAGNGSSDDSSSSPCPSTSLPKRPPAPPVAVSEPSHKRPAIENAHGTIGMSRIVPDNDEGSTRSPSISTTMIEGNAKGTGHEVNSQGTNDNIALDRVVDGSTNDQTEMAAEPKQKTNCETGDPVHRGGGDVEMDEEQSTSKICHITTMNATKSPAKDSDEKVHGDDWWDDYCYVCSQGCDETTGSLGCCDTCPKVFHAKCHVPMIKKTMEELPNGWQCTLCLPCDPLSQISQSFGEREKLLCSKVYLACFVDFSNVEHFLNAVSTAESDYYSVIKEPIWFNKIATKISSDEYKMISEFVEDMNLLFRNCSTFNLPTNPLSNSGKKVYTLYMKAMREFLPAYEKQIWIYVSLYNGRVSVASSNDEESVRRRGGKRGGQKAKSQTPC
ncbi:hypothetical protein niasHS_000551 [Heterodera schachtii]|uniref:E3 ubiquitin-protein ligase TRIM33 n=1 Tax=Heterodera schachtii TaxID=97005 RepID=A0ABD2K4J6_HETSC